MALSDPRILYGVHSFSPYSRTTGEYYGTCKVLKGSSLSLQGELVKLTGGSQKYPFAIEEGLITSELSLKVAQYEDFLIELFLGQAPTASSTDTSGTVSTITNKYGSTCVASTGIASVSVKAAEKTDLKFTKFLVKVVSATTVDVYAGSDIDFNRGTDKEYVNDLLKITASPLTITQATAVEIPDFGLELTGGAGVIAMTAGHTATFEVKPLSTKSMEVTIGSASSTFPEFGALVVGKQRSNGEMVELDLFRCKAAGLPIGFEANAYSEAEIKAEVFYDSAKNGIFKMRHITPS
jgi:hypothetical protein